MLADVPKNNGMQVAPVYAVVNFVVGQRGITQERNENRWVREKKNGIIHACQYLIF